MEKKIIPQNKFGKKNNFYYLCPMNIFVLDTNPKKCAEYHNDKHVVKMILETFVKFYIFINKKIWKLVKFVKKHLII